VVAVAVVAVAVVDVISPGVAEETSDPFATALVLRKGQSHGHRKAALLAHRKAALPGHHKATFLAHRKAGCLTGCPVISQAWGTREECPPVRNSKFRTAGQT
jgi:hypothetical protein